MRRAAILIVAAFAWCIAHNTAVVTYGHFCAPCTLLGVLTSPFLLGTPHCTALRWIIVHGAWKTDALWMLLGDLAAQALA